MSNDFTEQNISNCLWAAAKVGMCKNEATLEPLFLVAIKLAPSFIHAQAASNCIWVSVYDSYVYVYLYRYVYF